jgi:hypothetical protein
MFQHQNRIRSGDGNGPARTPFTDNHGDNRRIQTQTGFDGPGNCFGLAAFFRPNAGIGTGRVDQCDDRQIETVCQFHQPNGLAIAFRPGHAEIMGNSIGRIGPFFMA